MENLGISMEKDELESPGEFLIFTHSLKTRYWVLGSFAGYLILFFMLLDRLKNFLEKMDDLPAILKALEDNSSLFLTYGIMAMGVLIAFMILFYLLWAVVDVWGIQVHLSPAVIQVRNTITGRQLRKIMGVGEVRFDDLEEVIGGFFSTRLVGNHGQVQFSPVHHIEILIARIVEYAPKAKINVR